MKITLDSLNSLNSLNFTKKFKKKSTPNLTVLKNDVQTAEDNLGVLDTEITKREEQVRVFSESVQVEEEKFLKTKEEYLAMKEKFEAEEKALKEKKKEETRQQREVQKLKTDKNKKILEHAEKVQELNDYLDRLEQIRKMVVGGVDADRDEETIAEEIINKIDFVHTLSQTNETTDDYSNLGEITLNDGILTYKFYSHKNGEIDKTYLLETSFVEEGRKLEVYRQGTKVELIATGTKKLEYKKTVKEEEIDYIERYALKGLTALQNQYLEQQESKVKTI